MQIDISTTEKNFGQTIDFDFSENLPAFEHHGKLYSFNGKLCFQGSYTPSFGYMEVFATVDANLKTTCDKCLDDSNFDLSFNYLEKFERDAKIEIDQDAYVFNGNKIVFDTSIIDNVILNLPLYCYCKQDCKGLCMSCGIDLNKDTCNCEQENLKASNPFAALGDLFDNDKEV